MKPALSALDQRMQRLRQRLLEEPSQRPEEAAPQEGCSDDDQAHPQGFCQWAQWSQFNQIQ